MQIGVMVNLSKDNAQRAISAISQAFTERNIAGVFAKEIADAFPEIARSLRLADDVAKNSDYLLVVGGDGTILSAVKLAASNDIPILGVNTGNVGFLTEYDVSEIELACDEILGQAFTIDSRLMIETCIDGETSIALNDIVVTKGRTDTVLPIEVFVNEERVDFYHADGFLVSTPTGSTAYSLSCGGAILAPDVNALILTPICSHSLHSRPIVVSDEATVRICAQGKALYPVIDGKPTDAFVTEIVIKRSASVARFVKTNRSSFYQKLLTKLNQWGK